MNEFLARERNEMSEAEKVAQVDERMVDEHVRNIKRLVRQMVDGSVKRGGEGAMGIAARRVQAQLDEAFAA